MSTVGKRLTIALAAFVLLPAVALAGTGVGAVFNLGKTNKVNAQSTLTGTAGRMLQVTNTNTGASSTAIGATSKGSTGPAIKASNTGGGPALGLSVGAGKAPLTVNSTGKVAKLNADLLDGQDSTTFQRAYNHTIVVSPVGTSVQNGSALLAALASITTASSSNPYLLKVEPGFYDLNHQTLSMKPWVDIEGSGEQQTTIHSDQTVAEPTLYGADNAELRFLTVENEDSIAIRNVSASPRLTHITARAYVPGGSPQERDGVYNTDSNPIMTYVTAIASGGQGQGSNLGVYNANSSPTMTQVTALASDGRYDYAVGNNGSSPTMTYVTADASSSYSPSSANYQYGVLNRNVSNPLMDHVFASGTGGGASGHNVGVEDDGSYPALNASVVEASGTGTSYGLEAICELCGGSYTIKINNSEIGGGTNSVNNGYLHATIDLGGSQLAGGAVANSGTLTCVDVWNGSYAALNSTCA